MAIRITNRRKAGDNHEVVTVTGKDGSQYRKTVCAECPWRKDSPVGAFPAKAFEISANCAEDMAQQVFGCHMSGAAKPTTCAGFLLKNSANNMKVRMAIIHGNLDPRELRETVPLYNSYKEMATANGVPASSPALRNCRSDDE